MAHYLQARDQEIDRLSAIIKELQRHRFGRRSEQLDPDQLALDEVEQTLSATEAADEKNPSATPDKPPRRRRINHGALPPHLPREEDVLDRSTYALGGVICLPPPNRYTWLCVALRSTL
ncbi:MAG: hypothetical protein GEV13_24120 [Rhodospirillales bacterium]|nr:hypothetical protein [Rhodospirillales bacterium]